MAVQGTFASTGSVEQYADIGDVIEYQFPDIPDPNLSDVAITLRGVLTCEVEPLPPTELQYWNSSASSSDGSELVAVANGSNGSAFNGSGSVWNSHDSGVSWNNQDSIIGVGSWTGSAISSNGSHIVVCAYGGYIWTSNDYGLEWTQRSAAGIGTWTAVSCSSDGSKITAVMDTGVVWTSGDSGVTWTMQSGLSANLQSISSDTSGLNLITGDNNSNSPALVYLSTDGGVSWSSSDVTGYSGGVTDVTSNSDGSKLVIMMGGSFVLRSTNSGSTWGVLSPGGVGSGVACDGNGDEIISIDDGGGVWLSMDSGASFSLNFNPDPNYLLAGSISENGSVFVCGDYNTGSLHVSLNTGSSWSTVVL